MRLQGYPFPQIVYKIAIEKRNVIHLHPRNSKTSNLWRLLNIETVLKRRIPLPILKPALQQERRVVKLNNLQLDLSLDHHCVEAKVTINDLF